MAVSTRRTRTSIKVSLINVKGLEAGALAYVKEKGIEPKATEARAGFAPHGFVKTPKGIYALSSEGIGPANPISKDNPYAIDFYVSCKEGKKAIGHCFPSCGEELDEMEIQALATGEEAPLDEFIRAFGSRLDGNYESWRAVLEKAQEV